MSEVLFCMHNEYTNFTLHETSKALATVNIYFFLTIKYESGNSTYTKPKYTILTSKKKDL